MTSWTSPSSSWCAVSAEKGSAPAPPTRCSPPLPAPEIRIRRANVPAMKFWSRALETWIGHPVARSAFSSEGIDWDLLRERL